MNELPRTIATHWGSYQATVDDTGRARLSPVPEDPDPSLIGDGLAATVDSDLRIRQPMVRKSWLEKGPGHGVRGGEPFVAIDWARALDLVAGELDRVRRDHGNQAIFAGSYGWASAGRFHHAQSQLKRFLNLIGGFTYAVNAYSHAAAECIMPYVAGNFFGLQNEHHSWPTIAEHSELVVAFGGMPLKNAQVNSGGTLRHNTADGLRRCRDRGVRFINVGPVRDDVADFLQADWLAPRPNTDVALMLGLAHTLVAEDRHDPAFLDRYCVGFDRFLPYLMGKTDGQPKDAEWAAGITGLDAGVIRDLARDMADKRTLITLSWSLQRADHGEQPYWMAITLAAILGQIGLPGGGFGYGYGAVSAVGDHTSMIRWASVPQGENAVTHHIPVSRIAEMLENPGGQLDYNGKALTFPDVRLIYWAGGNPFHHHQDLNRLVAAWQKPETVVVHEPWWTPIARHADIVLPVTTALERNDVACSSRDGFLLANKQALPAFAEARSDHAILTGLADRFGCSDAFTEGRDEMEWLRHLYDISRQRAAQSGFEMPDFDDFWAAGRLELPLPEQPKVFLDGFRADPKAAPLDTPTGKLEIWSDTIAGYGYDDCPGHPVWQAPYEWLGAEQAARYPLHLVSNQPVTRLHSQLDHGPVSRDSKIAGREPMTINPADATARGIADGDVVRVFNDRGACLAGAVVSDAVMPGAIQLPTGAWFDPATPGVPGGLEKHGNANVLTADRGTSKLAQGPTAHSCLVEVERFDGDVPPVTVFDPPEILPGL